MQKAAMIGFFILLPFMHNAWAMQQPFAQYPETQVLLGVMSVEDYLKAVELSDFEYSIMLKLIQKSNPAAYDFIIASIKEIIAAKTASIQRGAKELYYEVRNLIDITYARLSAAVC